MHSKKLTNVIFFMESVIFYFLLRYHAFKKKYNQSFQEMY